MSVIKYPAALDDTTNLPTIVDSVTPVSSATLNNLRDGIVAIEAELGIKPSGFYTTVRARFDNIDAVLSAIVVGGGGFLAGGDLTGTVTSQTVVGLQGQPVAATTPTDGYVLTFKFGQWTPRPPTGGGGTSFIAGGDLSGNAVSQAVVGLRSVPLTAGTPTAGQLYIYDGYNFSLGTNFYAQPLSTSGQITSGPIVAASVSTGLNLSTGKNIYNGIGTISTLSDPAQLITYYDSTRNKFMASENGGPYLPVFCNKPTVTALPATMTISDVMICCTNGGTLSLLASPPTGLKVKIKDTAGTAGTSAITIAGNGKNIDGQSSVILNLNYAVLDLHFTGTEWSIV